MDKILNHLDNVTDFFSALRATSKWRLVVAFAILGKNVRKTLIKLMGKEEEDVDKSVEDS